ncbi:hypothetical protein PR048_018180 [Dryococelus australis]|uniref:Uncharacterized protein n=1 Tax=Dryococelus australis TaxID=614101 RepID=A0ABQ9HBQ7_9NEOP|nr:hypothetical protein PR048_018180 [Dryococelus australis]
MAFKSAKFTVDSLYLYLPSKWIRSEIGGSAVTHLLVDHKENVASTAKQAAICLSRSPLARNLFSCRHWHALTAVKKQKKSSVHLSHPLPSRTTGDAVWRFPNPHEVLWGRFPIPSSPPRLTQAVTVNGLHTFFFVDRISNFEWSGEFLVIADSAVLIERFQVAQWIERVQVGPEWPILRGIASCSMSTWLQEAQYTCSWHMCVCVRCLAVKIGRRGALFEEARTRSQIATSERCMDAALYRMLATPPPPPNQRQSVSTTRLEASGSPRVTTARQSTLLRRTWVRVPPQTGVSNSSRRGGCLPEAALDFRGTAVMRDPNMAANTDLPGANAGIKEIGDPSRRRWSYRDSRRNKMADERILVSGRQNKVVAKQEELMLSGGDAIKGGLQRSRLRSSAMAIVTSSKMAVGSLHPYSQSPVLASVFHTAGKPTTTHQQGTRKHIHSKFVDYIATYMCTHHCVRQLMCYATVGRVAAVTHRIDSGDEPDSNPGGLHGGVMALQEERRGEKILQDPQAVQFLKPVRPGSHAKSITGKRRKRWLPKSRRGRREVGSVVLPCLTLFRIPPPQTLIFPPPIKHARRARVTTNKKKFVSEMRDAAGRRETSETHLTLTEDGFCVFHAELPPAVAQPREIRPANLGILLRRGWLVHISDESRGENGAVDMEEHRNAMAEETGDPRENTPTSGIVRHDHLMPKSRSDCTRTRTRTGLVEDEHSRKYKDRDPICLCSVTLL